jgi:hypothetical protein
MKHVACFPLLVRPLLRLALVFACVHLSRLVRSARCFCRAAIMRAYARGVHSRVIARGESCSRRTPGPCRKQSLANVRFRAKPRFRDGALNFCWASHAYLTSPAEISRPIIKQSCGRCASCAGRRACRAAPGYTRRVRRTWAAFSLVTFSLAAQEKVTSTRAAPGHDWKLVNGDW